MFWENGWDSTADCCSMMLSNQHVPVNVMSELCFKEPIKSLLITVLIILTDSCLFSSVTSTIEVIWGWHDWQITRVHPFSCHTCCGGFVKPACLGVATAPKPNKSKPANVFYSSAISSALISPWTGTDSMLSDACYLGVAQDWLPLQQGCRSASPPVVLGQRTKTWSEVQPGA